MPLDAIWSLLDGRTQRPKPIVHFKKWISGSTSTGSGFLFSVPTQRYLKDLKTYLSLDISFFEIFPPSASSCHLKNVLDWNSPNKFSFENSRSGNRSDIGPAMVRTIRMHPLDPQRSPGTYGKLPGSIWNFGDTMSGVTCCGEPMAGYWPVPSQQEKG